MPAPSPGSLASNPPPRWGAPGDDRAAPDLLRQARDPAGPPRPEVLHAHVHTRRGSPLAARRGRRPPGSAGRRPHRAPRRPGRRRERARPAGGGRPRGRRPAGVRQRAPRRRLDLAGQHRALRVREGEDRGLRRRPRGRRRRRRPERPRRTQPARLGRPGRRDRHRRRAVPRRRAPREPAALAEPAASLRGGRSHSRRHRRAGRGRPRRGAVALLAVTGSSNVTGELLPIAQLADLAHAHGARLVVDAAQLAPHRRIDLAAAGVDYVAFSGPSSTHPSVPAPWWAAGTGSTPHRRTWRAGAPCAR